MPRFEIVLSRVPKSTGVPGEHRIVLGRLASVLATVLTSLVALALVTVAVVLGSLIAGAIIAIILIALLMALLRGTFVALRR